MKLLERGFSKTAAVAAFALVLAWGAAPVVAQSADPSPAVADEASATPEELPAQPVEALPLSDVASQAEKITVEIDELRALVRPTEAVARARDELQPLEVSIADLESEFSLDDYETLPRSELDSVQRQWRRVAAKLKDVDQVVGGRSKVLEGRATGLVRAEELWTRTRESLTGQDVPAAVVERVDSVLLALREIQDALRERQAELFTLQDRITSDQIRAAQALDQLAGITADAKRKMFARTDRPIWRVLVESQGEEQSWGEQWKHWWQRGRSDLAEFARDFKDELVLHVVLAVLLVIVLARLGRRARSCIEKEPELERVAAVLSRPIAAGYLVAATGTVVLYPDAPATVYRIAYLTATVPLFLLVRAIAPVAWRRALYGPVALFAALHLGRVVPGIPVFQRLHFLVLTVAAAAGLIWLLLRFRREGRWETGGWWRATMIVLRVAAAMLVVSFLANLFGLFELTIVLTGGLFNSAYMALATVVSVLILDGAVAVALETEAARNLRMVRYHPQPIRRRVSTAIHLVGAMLWSWVTLLIFDLEAPILRWITAVLGRKWVVGTLEASLGGLLVFVITIWIAVQISRFVRFALEEDIYPRLQLDRGLPGTISMLVRYTILAIGFLIAVAAAGIPLSNFAILVGALGVGIGFGMQNIVNNFISGLILAFERPIQIGDTVEVGQILGEVRMIGIRASNVRTFDGAEVIVPNGDLISAQVINWTLSDRTRRILLPVGVAYGTDPQRVIEILQGVAEQHEDVASNPSPTVLFLGFGESSLDFEMRFWTGSYDRWWKIRSEVAVAVNAALAEARIEIPFPQRDLHVRSVDSDAARSLNGAPVAKRDASAPEGGPTPTEEDAEKNDG